MTSAPSAFARIKARARYRLRYLAYHTPVVQNVFSRLRQGADGEANSAAYWDQALTTWAKSYLGGTLQVDVRDAMTVSLIRNRTSRQNSLLDIGCAAGSLLESVRSFIPRYVGVDISNAAIDIARKKWSSTGAAAEFHASPLEEFRPKETFDIVVFNEVLYYLGVADSIKQLGRLAEHVSDDGCFIISMKNDPKSHAIFSEIGKRYEYGGSVLYQEQTAIRWKVLIARERPAFVIAVFRKRREGDGSV